MKILAGVDEAGLGPTLGPLTTACGALSVPDSWQPDTPWDALSCSLCRDWRRGETRTAVTDSKVVYKSGGIGALEKAVGTFSLLANASSAPPIGFSDIEMCAGIHSCYSGRLEPFPVSTDAEDLADAALRIGAALTGADAGAAHLEVGVLYEPVLNRRFAAGLNKNEALLAETGRHLSRLAAKFPEHPILVMVDKQGGRNNYLPFLMSLFPGAWLEELTAGGQLSSYRMRRTGGDVEFRFQAKADRISFPTALASLAAKYVRERAMAELNAWFSERVESLEPTAGYPEDARRWLMHVRKAPNVGELGLELVVRER